jgi:hypothetical protein
MLEVRRNSVELFGKTGRVKLGSPEQTGGTGFVPPRWASSLFELLIKCDVCRVFSVLRYRYYVVCIIIQVYSIMTTPLLKYFGHNEKFGKHYHAWCTDNTELGI